MKNFLLRFCVAVPVVGGVLVILTMFLTATPTVNPTFVAVAVIGLILLGMQTWANFNRQLHEPTLALKYWDMFEEIADQRKRACQHFLKHKEWSVEVEDVLDLMDDLGFYVQTIHISREVLHQYFYWWIRGYVMLATSYIKSKQRGDEAKKLPPDPTRWEYCELLLKEVSSVEAKRLKKVGATDQRLDWSEDQTRRFLKEEAEED